MSDLIRDERIRAAAPAMLEALQNLENDDGSIPKFAWDMVQAAIHAATEEPELYDGGELDGTTQSN